MNVLEYSSDIDAGVIKAVTGILQIKVNGLKRITKGEQNFVYKVSSGKTNYIVRVFKEKWWPEEDKYIWIDDNLTKHDILHTKVLHYTRNDKYFPFGFMILEFIEGINGEEAIKNGMISFKEFHQKLFKVLDKVHSIPVERFGLIKKGKGEYRSYVDYKLGTLKGSINEIRKIPGFEIELLKNAESMSKTILEKTDFRPVLTHGDATPCNTIYTSDGNVILIDWDDARAGAWFDDYAWILYCGSHISTEGSLDERRRIIYNLKKEFVKNKSLQELEKVLFLIKAIELLPYYYFIRKDINAFELTLKKVHASIKQQT